MARQVHSRGPRWYFQMTFSIRPLLPLMSLPPFWTIFPVVAGVDDSVTAYEGLFRSMYPRCNDKAPRLRSATVQLSPEHTLIGTHFQRASAGPQGELEHSYITGASQLARQQRPTTKVVNFCVLVSNLD